MIGTIIFKIFHLARSPIILAVFLGSIAIYLFTNRESYTSSSNDVVRSAEEALEDMKKFDPEVARIVSEVDDKRQQRALSVAALSASGRDSRSTLAGMARETAATGELPYRARLAALALNETVMTDLETKAYLQSHAMACQTLELAGGFKSSHEYVTLLEQARRNPSVWPLVKDDPLGLVIWSESDNIEGLKFYHRNREWLADPLAALDLSGAEDGGTVGQVIDHLMRHEESLKKAIVEGEIGVYGVAVMMTHGGLVETCRASYGIHPAETISVIVMNRDILLEEEGDNKWIGERASWLAQIEKHHPTVWFAAGMSPFALRLHRDAPHVSDSLLEKHGAEDVPALIYQHFTNTEEVAAAASALDTFGDLAIYVFARYEDPEFISKLGKYLTDEEIGIRIIPFILRFEDDAFSRIEEDKDWLDRYFAPDGSPREGKLDWIQYLPGGSAVHVATTWAQGYPCEWSELGWAAFDVAEIALVIATFGTSKTVTTAAKAGAVAARASRTGQVAKVATRATRVQEWSKSLGAFRAATSSLARRMPRLARVSANIAAVGRTLATPIWGVYKLSRATVQVVWRGATGTLNAWKSLSPAGRSWIKRGLLGASLFITITQRTLPNMDEIGKGIGEMLGQAAAGVVALAGEALVNAILTFLEAETGSSPLLQIAIFWVLIITLAIASVWFLAKGVRSFPRARFASL